MKTSLKLLCVTTLLVCVETSALRSEKLPEVNPELQRCIAARDAAAAALKKAEDELAACLKKTHPQQLEEQSPVLASDAVAQALTKSLKAANVKVRRSVKDSKTAELPALFQYTHPGNGSDSWAVDAGVSFERDIADGIGLGAYGEYHFSDAIGKLKDSVLAGGSLDFVLRNHPQDENELPDTLLLRTTFGYKRDNLVSGEGYLTDFTLFPQVEELFLDRSFGREETNGWFEGRIIPFAGIQYEEGNGDRVSLRGGIGFVASLAPRYFGDRLTLASNLTYWNHCSTSGAMEGYDKNQWYWVTALTYWFNTPGETGVLTKEDQHFGVSAGYTKGDSPELGEFDADLLTVGFSVKF